ncbi:acetyltransferase [Acinetobacter qingfengensis]|uniref:Acetyltransferase n=1 Tax=Acinetobacter qingfengensis TaxID=1262585 RepID=A0A1E7RCY1_9GAMM|nr:acetyltransferase [Acinetobacter qingfengensis]KAA8732073.1 acetyltransferase [Acinetobacter qingfengensis]OEY97153.1 acetyltransferase [Acinetobacter qingfengensis]
MSAPAIYAVFGASGCGRSLMPIAREQLTRLSIQSQIYFIDDALNELTMINGHPALNYSAFQALEVQQKYVLIAIANSQVREKLAAKIQQDGMQLWTVQANLNVVMDQVEIAAGAALSPFVTIGSNVRIGCCFHANLYSYVEHDCVIGDFVTFAPGVKCNGNVHIADHVYIGAGAMIKQGTTEQPLCIGQGAVIGMGAVVTKNVPAGVTVVGNPARILNTNNR